MTTLCVFVILTGCTLNARIDSLETAASPSKVEEEAPTVAEPSMKYTVPKEIYTKNESIHFVPTTSGRLKNFRISPSLPIGLDMDTETGIISGNPSAPSLKQVYTIQTTVDAESEISTQITFEVAANFEVDSTSDLSDLAPGDGLCTSSGASCTLRAAIEEANSQSPGILSIVNLPTGTFGLPSQGLIISSRITLKGTGRNNTIIDANPDSTPISPVIDIQTTSTEVLIDGITVKNGGLSAPTGTILGVGLKSQATNLVLKNCEISNNAISGTSAAAVTGVGLYHKSTGLFTMDNCNIQNNTGNLTNAAGYSWGAGAYIEAARTNISNSNISNNTFPIAQGASGGAGLTLLGNSSITKTTISNNQARNFAAGIYYSSAFEHELNYSSLEQNATNSLAFGNHIYLSGTSKLNIFNSALLDSTSAIEHIFASSSVTLTIQNSTLYSTVASELIELSSAIANIEASTLYSVGGNTINFRLSSGTLFTKSSIYWTGNFTCTSHTNPVVSYGYNVFPDTTCNTGNPNDVIDGNSPLISPANNGGTTKTMATAADSPARNIVPVAQCLGKDQRDNSRTLNNFCDSGAYQH